MHWNNIVNFQERIKFLVIFHAQSCVINSPRIAERKGETRVVRAFHLEKQRINLRVQRDAN